LANLHVLFYLLMAY